MGIKRSYFSKNGILGSIMPKGQFRIFWANRSIDWAYLYEIDDMSIQRCDPYFIEIEQLVARLTDCLSSIAASISFLSVKVVV